MPNTLKKLLMGKAIVIASHMGEIGCEDERFHYPGYAITEGEDYNEGDEWYEVDVHLIQESTSTDLRTVKEFESMKFAREFALRFISENPLCEIVIRRKTSKELFYYV